MNSPFVTQVIACFGPVVTKFQTWYIINEAVVYNNVIVILRKVSAALGQFHAGATS